MSRGLRVEGRKGGMLRGLKVEGTHPPTPARFRGFRDEGSQDGLLPWCRWWGEIFPEDIFQGVFS